MANSIRLPFTEMDAAKRRAMIKAQATKKVEDGSQVPKGTGPNNPSTKRKTLTKQDRVSKKPRIPLDTVMGLEAEGAKTVTPDKHGAGKGLMKGPSPSQKKPPVLLRKDPKYALEMLTSIMTTEDYEDLSNHSIEVMGETGLFSIAQVTLHPSILHPSVLFSSHLTPPPFFLFRQWS